MGAAVGNVSPPVAAEHESSGGDAVSDPSESVASESVDSEVLRLRGMGRAFPRISKDLGWERALDAQRAFQRALRALPSAERQRVRREEASRLDRLAERVRADTSKTDLDRARQLKAIERTRTQILDEGPTSPIPSLADHPGSRLGSGSVGLLI